MSQENIYIRELLIQDPGLAYKRIMNVQIMSLLISKLTKVQHLITARNRDTLV